MQIFEIIVTHFD